MKKILTLLVLVIVFSSCTRQSNNKVELKDGKLKVGLDTDVDLNIKMDDLKNSLKKANNLIENIDIKKIKDSLK